MELEYTKRVGANGKLFGAVSATDISKSLADKGLTVEKRQIAIKDAIKAVGNFEVVAKLFNEVEANFKVKVVMDPAQVEEMKKKQEAAAKKKAKKAEQAAEAKTEENAEGEAEAAAEGETSETSES